jgi:tetratricopeptide (TPR) repeat protein
MHSFGPTASDRGQRNGKNGKRKWASPRIRKLDKTSDHKMARASRRNQAKHFEEGIARANAGDWAGAEAAFSTAIASGHDTWEVFTSRGNVRQELGQLDAAVEDFSHAVDVAPEQLTPRFNRANARALAGDLGGAVDDYTAVVDIDGAFSRAYERRGLVLQRLGQDSAAESDFSRTIELSPDRAEPYAHRAALRALRGAIDDALRDCQRALALMPAHGKQRDATTRLLKTLERATKGGSAAPPPSRVRASQPSFPAVPKVPAGLARRANVPGGDALAVVERLLKKQKAKFRAQSLGDELGTVRFSAPAKVDGLSGIEIELLAAESRLLLYLVLDGRPKPAAKRELVEFLTRANAGLVSGNYEYSFESNQVRFKTSLDFRGKKLSFVLTENLWLHAHEAHAAYSDSLAAVLRGKQNAREAIAQCE